MTIKVREVSSFRDYFSGFFVLLVDWRKDSKEPGIGRRGTKREFLKSSGVSCCCPSLRSCAHMAKRPVQEGLN